MYDEIIKNIPITTDEINLMIQLLESKLENCISIGEEIVVTELLTKLNIEVDT